MTMPDHPVLNLSVIDLIEQVEEKEKEEMRTKILEERNGKLVDVLLLELLLLLQKGRRLVLLRALVVRLLLIR